MPCEASTHQGPVLPNVTPGTRYEPREEPYRAEVIAWSRAEDGEVPDLAELAAELGQVGERDRVWEVGARQAGRDRMQDHGMSAPVAPVVLQLRVVLRGISPLIWRRILIRSEPYDR